RTPLSGWRCVRRRTDTSRLATCVTKAVEARHRLGVALRRHLSIAAGAFRTLYLSEVPKQLVQALLATEDRNFYSHHGFDLRGIARAAFSFLRLKGLQGGSTLTQQLVKNFFLT